MQTKYGLEEITNVECDAKIIQHTCTIPMVKYTTTGKKNPKKEQTPLLEK